MLGTYSLAAVEFRLEIWGWQHLRTSTWSVSPQDKDPPPPCRGPWPPTGSPGKAASNSEDEDALFGPVETAQARWRLLGPRDTDVSLSLSLLWVLRLGEESERRTYKYFFCNFQTMFRTDFFISGEVSFCRRPLDFLISEAICRAMLHFPGQTLEIS